MLFRITSERSPMIVPSPIPDICVDSRLYLSGLTDLRHAIDGIGGPAADRVRHAIREAELAHLVLIVETKRMQLDIDVEGQYGR